MTLTNVSLSLTVGSSIDHIIGQIMINATDYASTSDVNGGSSRSSSIYMLKVKETNEYLPKDSLLKDFEYVHQCLKFSRDHIDFVLVEADTVQRPFQRTVFTFDNIG